MTKSTLDLARECGASGEWKSEFYKGSIEFSEDELDAFAERIRANANRLTALLANWDARALCALPADAMIVNKMARELREALAQPSPAAVERKPLSNFVAADQFMMEPHTDDVFSAYQQGIRFAERYYGIVGITARQGGEV